MGKLRKTELPIGKTLKRKKEKQKRKLPPVLLF